MKNNPRYADRSNHISLINRLIYFTILATFFGTSCVKDNYREVDDLKDTEPSNILTKSTTDNLIHQANPYSIEVMQTVYNTYDDRARVLIPTDLYVKFMPRDSSELNILQNEYGLELFNYPLDVDFNEGDDYVEFAPSSEVNSVYAVVDYDFVFPNIDYTVLDECYIPDEEEYISSSVNGIVNVEAMAYSQLGYEYIASATTRSRQCPSGTFYVVDNSISPQGIRPLKGVKVRCHRFVKYMTAYTDENGYYEMPGTFNMDPHYTLVFENIRGFNIWGNWGPLSSSSHQLGTHSKNGYTTTIGSNSSAWEWATVNNAAYEYYTFCDSTGISLPPEKLKIWVWKNEEYSSTPMLNHLRNAIGYNGDNQWYNFFVNVGYGVTATLIYQTFAFICPDITIGTENKDSKAIFQHVCHELSHASHYANVGSSFWSTYVSYIMTYGAYGDGNGNNAQLCGIGEMWGYYMGYWLEYEKYRSSASDYLYPHPDLRWFKPETFWELSRQNILTSKEIFDALQPDVRTYNDLAIRLFTLYPSKAEQIYTVLSQNLAISVTPGRYSNLIVSDNSVFRGDDIYVDNVSVLSGAILNISFIRSVTIEDEFVVEEDGSLIMIREQ